MVRGWWVGWLYSGSRSFEAKFPPASIPLKTEGCRVEQVFISRVSHPVPNIVIYIYQNPTNPGVRATKRFTNDTVCLLRKPSKTEPRNRLSQTRKWTNNKKNQDNLKEKSGQLLFIQELYVPLQC